MRIRVIVITFFILICNNLEAKRLLVRSIQDLQEIKKEQSAIIIVHQTIDLKGNSIILPLNSKLKFRNGGFLNGVVIGQHTFLYKTKKNVFHNCIIKGEWLSDNAFSSMFDDEIETMQLFHNLSSLSPNIKLFSNRHYSITANDEELEVESIEAAGNEKPTIEFHTVNPNINGLKIIGDEVKLKNLIITDDYHPTSHDDKYVNDLTIGNTIAVVSRKKEVNSLLLENCDFHGGTSSSFVASSQVHNCYVKGCSFSGYMSDHAVYCSMKVERFVVKDCRVNNIEHTKGLFKIRSSNKVREFTLQNISVNNLNGYFANISLLESPSCQILFDHLTVTKDSDNSSVFYGFCLNDETKALSGKGYNADKISVSNCHFEYGYEGAPLIYHGSGEQACLRTIRYFNTIANGSNFAGGNADNVYVKNCIFDNCSGKNGIVLRSRRVCLDNTIINGVSDCSRNCLFLVNYYREPVEALVLRNVKITSDSSNLIKIVRGENINVSMRNSIVNSNIRSMFKAPINCSIDYSEDNNKIKKASSFKVIDYTIY